MLFKVKTLCWEHYEGKLPVEKIIYISGMSVNLHEKITIGFFLGKKETNDRYIYYLIKEVERLFPKEEALSGIYACGLYMELLVVLVIIRTHIG